MRCMLRRNKLFDHVVYDQMIAVGMNKNVDAVEANVDAPAVRGNNDINDILTMGMNKPVLTEEVYGNDVLTMVVIAVSINNEVRDERIYGEDVLAV